MSKLKITIYHIIFVVFIILPVPSWFLLKDKFDTENYEYRTLSTVPDMKTTGITAYPAAFEGYFNDNLPYKNELVEADSAVRYFGFKSSSEADVLIGKDDWLFSGGSPEYYRGKNLLTEEELETLAVSMNEADEFFKSRGCDFIIYFAPGKERIYPEYMPDAYGEPAEEHMMKQIAAYLREHTDIKVIEGETALSAYKKEHPDTQTYLRYDTHWNEQGGYVGASELSEYLGYPMKDLSDITVIEENYPQKNLARLLHLQDLLNDDHSRVLKDFGENGYKYDITTGDMHFYNPDGTDERKVMVIGDSFRVFMQQYGLKDFKEGYSDQYYNYSREVFDEYEPDIFIYESYEYLIFNLKDFKP